MAKDESDLLDIYSGSFEEMALDARNDSTDRLDQRSQFQSTDGGRRKHGREQEVVGRGDDGDMVIIRVELLDESNTAPASTEDDELGLVLLSLLLGRLIVVKEVFGNGQILGTTSSGVQSELRDRNVNRVGVFLVCSCIKGEEGEDEDTRDYDEDTEDSEAAPEEAEDSRTLYRSGGGRSWRRICVCALVTDVVEMRHNGGSCEGCWRWHALQQLTAHRSIDQRASELLRATCLSDGPAQLRPSATAQLTKRLHRGRDAMRDQVKETKPREAAI
jgi:hypothetical protein